jgi:hypothetical protein
MPPAPTLEELRQWDRRYVWHPFTQRAEYEPLLFETLRVPAPDPYRLPPSVRREDATSHYLQ